MTPSSHPPQDFPGHRQGESILWGSALSKTLREVPSREAGLDDF